MRQDKKRRRQNISYKEAYKSAIKKAKRTKSSGKNKGTIENLKDAYSKIDKATKKGIMHKNKAARLKSHVARIAHPKKK